MISLSQIEKAVCSVLREKTKMPTYSNEVKEGFKLPCFFTSCRFVKIETQKNNLFDVEVSVSIMFLPSMEQLKRVRSESLNLKMSELLIKSFLPNLDVDGRRLIVNRVTTDFTGEDGDILVLGFSLEYPDAFDKSEEDTERLIEEIFIEEDIKTQKGMI